MKKLLPLKSKKRTFFPYLLKEQMKVLSNVALILLEAVSMRIIKKHPHSTRKNTDGKQ